MAFERHYTKQALNIFMKQLFQATLTLSVSN